MGIYDDDEGYDDLNTGRGNSGGGGLRKQLEDALAEIKTLRGSNAKLQRAVNTTTLRDVLQEKGLRPGLAKSMTADGVDPSDPKAVTDWLTNPQNQEDHAFSLDAEGKAPAPQPEESAEPADDRNAAAFAHFQRAQNNALPADPTKLAGAAKLMESAQTNEEILAALAAAQR